MFVVGIEVELRVPAAASLKDKRRVITSVLDTARRRLHVSAAEVGAQDSWQRAVLGFAVVASSAHLAESTLDEVERLLWARPELEIVTIEQRWAE